jgi:Fe-S cluster assembly scaffold protein SufB
MFFQKPQKANSKRFPQIFLKTAKMCGMSEVLKSKNQFFVEENQVLKSNFPKGVKATYKETANGIKAKIIIQKNQKIKEPLFFCFGISDKKFHQEIYPEIIFEENSEATIQSHCSFPNSKDNQHDMEGFFIIGKSAKFNYIEKHYHGEKSGATVSPKMKVQIAEGGQFISDFNLTQGTVGQVKIELEAFLKKDAKAEIGTKVFGTNHKDNIEIIDKIHLEGENSKSLITMRAAAKNGGRVLMQGETYAQAPGSFGHIDCQEIVIGQNSSAKAIPIVEVTHDQARVTHEASVGKINQKELETLMTRGLNEEEATDLIVNALMKS